MDIIQYVKYSYNEYEENKKDVFTKKEVQYIKNEMDERRKEKIIIRELKAKKEYEELLERRDAINYYGLIALYDKYVRRKGVIKND